MPIEITHFQSEVSEYSCGEITQSNWLNLWSCIKIHNKYVCEVLALELMFLMNMVNQVVWNTTI